MCRWEEIIVGAVEGWEFASCFFTGGGNEVVSFLHFIYIYIYEIHPVAVTSGVRVVLAKTGRKRARWGKHFSALYESNSCYET